MNAAPHAPHDHIFTIALSPHYASDQTMFCSISHINHFILKSEDGGVSWEPSQCGMPHAIVLSIVLSPTFDQDRIAFAGTADYGILKSTDGGASWFPANELLPSPLTVCDIVLSPRFAIDQTVFAATDASGVYRSTDAGATWAPCAMPQPGQYVRSLAISSSFAQDRTLFAGTKLGLLKSTDGGTGFDKVGDGQIDEVISSVALSPSFAGDQTVFVATWGKGLFKSTNGGDTWAECQNGITEYEVAEIAVSPEFQNDQTLLAATRKDGVFRSTSGGASWYLVNDGIDVQAPQTDTHYFTLTFSPDFVNDRTVFLGAWEGVHKSETGGESWRHMNSYSENLIRGMAISPFFAEDGTVFAGSYGGGIYRSQDFGANWECVDTGLQQQYLGPLIVSPQYSQDNTVFAGLFQAIATSTLNGDAWSHVTVDPSEWFLCRSMALSTNFVNDGTIFLGSDSAGKYSIYRSTDRGTSYTPVDTSFTDAQALAVSPDYRVDGTLFAATRGGVYRSRNCGLTWTLTGLKSCRVFTLVMSPTFESDGVIFAGTLEKGVFKSSDFGDTWTAVNTGLTDLAIETICYFPVSHDEELVFAGSKSRGVFKSKDGGNTWLYSGLEGKFIRYMVISPNYPTDGTIFVGAWDGVHRSIDGGRTWERVLSIKCYDDGIEWVVYSNGRWNPYTTGYACGCGLKYSDVVNAKASLYFFGDSVSWIGAKAPMGGIANVYIDDIFACEVDLYDSQIHWQSRLFSETGLAYGEHCITVEVTGNSNPSATDDLVFVDAFQVGY